MGLMTKDYCRACKEPLWLLVFGFFCTLTLRAERVRLWSKVKSQT